MRYGFLQSRWDEWIGKTLHATFGTMPTSHKRVIGNTIFALHMALFVTAIFVLPFVCPPWLAGPVIVSMLVIMAHWYLIENCCVTAVENYFLGYERSALPHALRLCLERVPGPHAEVLVGYWQLVALVLFASSVGVLLYRVCVSGYTY